MNLEYLRHGKALCGNVFRLFVETFNFHNDFISNLKGDADLPVVGGKVKLDRTDERHPVIRCQGCGNGGGASPGSPLPWDVKVEDGDVYLFSPVVRILKRTSDEARQPKSIDEFVAEGCVKDQWNKLSNGGTDISGTGAVGGKIVVSTSGSGARSYRLVLGGFAGSVLYQFTAAKVQRQGTSYVYTGPVEQYFHGIPTITDLGIADRQSIDLNEYAETEIKGFRSQADETDKLATLLQRGSTEDEYEGAVLTRTTDSNGEHHLKFIPIGKGVKGGGDTTGYTGPVNVPTGELRCDSSSGYYIQSAYNVWTFQDGLLKSIDTTTQWMQGGLETTPLSGT